MTFHYCIVYLLAVACLAGCGSKSASAPSATPSVATSTSIVGELQARVIVTNFARRKKIKLENYYGPREQFDTHRGEWEFMYVPKPSGMRSKTFIIVVDATGTAKILGAGRLAW